MVYYLSQAILERFAGTPQADLTAWLSAFQSITLRSAGAAVTALLLTLGFGRRVIEYLRRYFSQGYVPEARPEVKSPAEDSSGKKARKKHVPTMGGVLIVGAIDVSALLWAQLNELVIVTMFSMLGLTFIGVWDDMGKIEGGARRAGLSARAKFLAQVAVAILIVMVLWVYPGRRMLVSDTLVSLGGREAFSFLALLGAAASVLLIVGLSNAVNLTDGMDGLAIGCTSIVTGVLVVVTYVASHAIMADYLKTPHIQGAGELTVFTSAMAGACLGFLWFNCYPAQVFMGDTGALALGGAIGVIALLVHRIDVVLIASGVFLAEIGSVVIQVISSRGSRWLFKRDMRPFLCTPIHHHFEKLGWEETKIVTRFYIINALFCVAALAYLKTK